MEDLKNMNDRKFKIGDIAYRVIPQDDGGVLIQRHEVFAIGWTLQEGTFMDETNGDFVKKEFLAPSIHSKTFLENVSVFEFETLFSTREELSNDMLQNLDRKKLW